MSIFSLVHFCHLVLIPSVILLFQFCFLGLDNKHVKTPTWHQKSGLDFFFLCYFYIVHVLLCKKRSSPHVFSSQKEEPLLWVQLEMTKTRTTTQFENYSKCRMSIFEFWHLPPIFVLFKLTCLVTLFDHRKLQVFKTRLNELFWHF